MNHVKCGFHSVFHAIYVGKQDGLELIDLAYQW